MRYGFTAIPEAIPKAFILPVIIFRVVEAGHVRAILTVLPELNLLRNYASDV